MKIGQNVLLSMGKKWYWSLGMGFWHPNMYLQAKVMTLLLNLIKLPQIDINKNCTILFLVNKLNEDGIVDLVFKKKKDCLVKSCNLQSGSTENHLCIQFNSVCHHFVNVFNVPKECMCF